MAANRLAALLHQYDPDIEVLARIESVKKGIQWFQQQDPPDLVFMDIQLADGLSFEIFEIAEVKAPIIFTTAYDEYALKAFKVNSIDYLLKPIDKDHLVAAFKKLSQLRGTDHQGIQSGQMEELVRMLSQPYKSRFIIKVGEHIKSVAVKDIDCFFSREKATFFTTREPATILLTIPWSSSRTCSTPKFLPGEPSIHHCIGSHSRHHQLFQQPAQGGLGASCR